MRSRAIEFVDYALDTNAVRRLSAFSVEEWSSTVHSFRGANLTAAWIPWVIREVSATNLIRKELSPEGLQELQLAARRHDVLCRGRVLPDAGDLIRQAFYQLAERDDGPETAITSDGWTRDWLDRFLCLRDPSEVSSRDGDVKSVTLRRHANDEPWTYEVPNGFIPAAKTSASWLHDVHEEEPEITRLELAYKYFRGWVPFIAEHLDVPIDVREQASDRHSLGDVAGTALGGGLIEGWYVAGRALGIASNITENDSRDLAIGSYVQCVGTLVTEDKALRHVLRELLRDSGHVASFDEFMAGLD